MKLLLIILLLLTLAGCSANKNIQKETVPETKQTTALETTSPAPEETPEVVPPPVVNDDEFVKVKLYIPDIVEDLRYATENNFTNHKIYDFTETWLRYGTVKKLMAVQDELQQKGYCLKIWDGFRPVSAQFKLWEICPDPTYVANPNGGYSSHSRGNTVDLTIVQKDGTDVIMPTEFDDFSTLADRNYSDCSSEAASNAQLLEELMTKHGFTPYFGEWWHFTDTQTYPVDETFEPLK